MGFDWANNSLVEGLELVDPLLVSLELNPEGLDDLFEFFIELYLMILVNLLFLDLLPGLVQLSIHGLNLRSEQLDIDLQFGAVVVPLIAPIVKIIGRALLDRPLLIFFLLFFLKLLRSNRGRLLHSIFFHMLQIS